MYFLTFRLEVIEAFTFFTHLAPCCTFVSLFLMLVTTVFAVELQSFVPFAWSFVWLRGFPTSRHSRVTALSDFVYFSR